MFIIANGAHGSLWIVISRSNGRERILEIILMTKSQNVYKLLLNTSLDGKLVSYPSRFKNIANVRDRVVIGRRSTMI